MSAGTCNCFVARHPDAAAIDAALLRGEDPRDVAARFSVGKSRVYDHRKHLRADGAAAAPARHQDAPEASPAPAEPIPPSGPAKRTAAPPVERSTEPVERVERRVESGGMDAARDVQAAPSLTARALPAEGVPGGAYATAVQTIVGLKVSGAWRATHVEAMSIKFGLAKTSVRAAHAEAVRHLQMGMGDYLARQTTSALWTTKERDAAKDQAEAAKKHAERWRRQEREAQEAADRLEGKERFAALDQAARFGMLATKYDLSAEKWGMQALAHQRQSDEVLCLRGPKELHLSQQNNFGAEATSATLAQFAAALARRFADQPEILAALDEAAAELEREPGDTAAIVTTGEAA